MSSNTRASSLSIRMLAFSIGHFYFGKVGHFRCGITGVFGFDTKAERHKV
jgi:hypothetical protein